MNNHKSEKLLPVQSSTRQSMTKSQAGEMTEKAGLNSGPLPFALTGPELEKQAHVLIIIDFLSSLRQVRAVLIKSCLQHNFLMITDIIDLMRLVRHESLAAALIN